MNEQDQLDSALRRANGLIHRDRGEGLDPHRFDEALAHFHAVKSPPTQSKKTILTRLKTFFKKEKCK